MGSKPALGTWKRVGLHKPGTTGGHTLVKQPGLSRSAAKCLEALCPIRPKASARQKLIPPQNIDSDHQDGYKAIAFSFLFLFFPSLHQKALRRGIGLAQWEKHATLDLKVTISNPTIRCRD